MSMPPSIRPKLSAAPSAHASGSKTSLISAVPNTSSAAILHLARADSKAKGPAAPLLHTGDSRCAVAAVAGAAAHGCSTSEAQMRCVTQHLFFLMTHVCVPDGSGRCKLVRGCLYILSISYGQSDYSTGCHRITVPYMGSS